MKASRVIPASLAAIFMAAIGMAALDAAVYGQEQEEFCDERAAEFLAMLEGDSLADIRQTRPFEVSVTYHPTPYEMPRIPLVGKNRCVMILN